MSYRFNTLDIIVGAGMTAIVFGAILLFVASVTATCRGLKTSGPSWPCSFPPDGKSGEPSV